MKRKASIRNIAREAGVSHATVSYVLRGRSGEERIPAPTEKRVKEAADRLGWQPNYILSSFASGRTRLVGLWQRNFGSSFPVQVMRETEKVLRQQGYAMLISPAYSENSDEEYDLGLFNQWAVDGLIVMSGARCVESFAKRHPDWRLPLVDMGSFTTTDLPWVDSIYIDVLSSVREALERWYDSGRRRIAMLAGHSLEIEEPHPRDELYLNFVREKGLKEELIVFPKGASQRESAEHALRQHIAEYGCPEAIFCRSDETLMGADKALIELGYTIPSDVALLGIDGIRDLNYLYHPVSTVVQPVERMCSLAWDLLRDRIETNPQKPARHEKLTAHLDWHE